MASLSNDQDYAYLRNFKGGSNFKHKPMTAKDRARHGCYG